MSDKWMTIDSARDRERRMVTVSEGVWCDPEIVDIVRALNTGDLATVASCSGHGYRPGVISLADGRQLMVFDNLEHMEAAEAAYPLDINGEEAHSPAHSKYLTNDAMTDAGRERAAILELISVMEIRVRERQANDVLDRAGLVGVKHGLQMVSDGIRMNLHHHNGECRIRHLVMQR